VAKIDAHSTTLDRRSEPGARKLFFEQHARRAGDRLQDPRPGNQRVERERGFMGERMRGAHDQPHGFARERFEVEVVVLERRGETAEREIHFAAVQQLHHLVAGLAKNAHVEQRPFAFQRGDGHGEHVGRRAHDRADRQLTVTAAPLAFEVGGESG
jgi:hypothetical protein